MTPDPRHIAYEILRDAGQPRVTLDQALDCRDADISGMPPKDRALCHAIVFGVLRHRGRLDHLIRAFSDRPFERLDSGVVEVLRLTLFQLVFLDRVPDFAAIDTGVELAKKRAGRSSGGFVNAVLRRAAREQDDLALPPATGPLSPYLKVHFSIPKWLGTRWVKTYGKNRTMDLCRTLMEMPPLTLRTNMLKCSRQDLAARMQQEGITTEETPLSPAGLNIETQGQPPADLPGYSEGNFQVQDEAAQLVTQILAPGPGERVLDACAGLGGKSCHMAQLMENRGQVLAADVDPVKLERLGTEARRMGISIIRTKPLDITGATINVVGGFFDRVLVDAPCSGIGVIRRNPDTRWKRSVKDIQRNAARQKKILNAAASLVRPGGTLVYAVCSCEPEENEAVISHFLSKRKDFSPDRGAVALTIPGLDLKDSQAAWFKTFPSPGGMDGFFAARLKRTDTQ